MIRMQTFICIILLITALNAAPVPTLDDIKPCPNSDKCVCPDLAKFVAEAEGYRKCRYFDQLGVETIGIGFNLRRKDSQSIIEGMGLDYQEVLAGRQCLNNEQIYSLLEGDIGWAKDEAKQIVQSFGEQSHCIQNVIIDMTYNLGMPQFLGMVDFRNALNNKDYQRAYDIITNGWWCDLVQTRCVRNAKYIKHCGA